MEHSVLLFDGYCPGCNRIADSAMRHDRGRVLRYAPLQSDAGRALAQQYDFNPEGLAAVLIDDDQAWFKMAKVARLGRLINRRPWRIARLVRFLPATTGEALYDLVDRNRTRLLGVRDSCRLPTPEERELFLS